MLYQHPTACSLDVVAAALLSDISHLLLVLLFYQPSPPPSTGCVCLSCSPSCWASCSPGERGSGSCANTQPLNPRVFCYKPTLAATCTCRQTQQHASSQPSVRQHRSNTTHNVCEGHRPCTNTCTLLLAHTNTTNTHCIEYPLCLPHLEGSSRGC